MDFFPWPNGLGFQDADAWWQYVRVQTEETRLNLLMALALLSPEACTLLLRHDQELFDRFALTRQTVLRLSAIEASTLEEFARIFRLTDSSAE